MLLNITCPVCDNDGFEIKHTGLLDGKEKQLTPPPKGMQVVKCQECGLLYFNPIEDEFTRQAYYSKSYFVAPSEETQIGYPNYISGEQSKTKEAWGKDPILRWFNEEHGNNNPKSIIDVGCAIGAMLLPMIQAGWRCVGQDIARWAVEWGKDKYESDLRCGYLHNIDFSADEQFNCVLLWDVMEHERFPVKLLEKLNGITTDDMIGIIQTPDGTYAEDGWYYFSPHQHACTYTLDTLGMLLEKTGFEIYEEKVSPEPDEMIVLFRKKR